MLTFQTRDLLWLTLVVAICFGLGYEKYRYQAKLDFMQEQLDAETANNKRLAWYLEQSESRVETMRRQGNYIWDVRGRDPSILSEEIETQSPPHGNVGNSKDSPEE